VHRGVRGTSHFLSQRATTGAHSRHATNSSARLARSGASFRGVAIVRRRRSARLRRRQCSRQPRAARAPGFGRKRALGAGRVSAETRSRIHAGAQAHPAHRSAQKQQPPADPKSARSRTRDDGAQMPGLSAMQARGVGRRRVPFQLAARAGVISRNYLRVFNGIWRGATPWPGFAPSSGVDRGYCRRDP
jgi:hypothetical protein